MSIKKQFLKSKEVCKITFRISADEGEGSEKAAILGNFNDWQPEPMTRLKDGSYKLIKSFDRGQDYAFRYLLDEKKWLNEGESDELVGTEFPDAENSLIRL